MAKSCTECKSTIREIFGSVKTFMGNRKEFKSKTYTCPICKAVYTNKQYQALKAAPYEGNGCEK